jgi:hypothetical protein
MFASTLCLPFAVCQNTREIIAIERECDDLAGAAGQPRSFVPPPFDYRAAPPTYVSGRGGQGPQPEDGQPPFPVCQSPPPYPGTYPPPFPPQDAPDAYPVNDAYAEAIPGYAPPPLGYY